MYYKVIATSIIFLSRTWYLDAAEQGVDVPWNTYVFRFESILVSHGDDDMEVKLYVVHGTSTPCSAASRYHVPDRKIIEVAITL